MQETHKMKALAVLSVALAIASFGGVAGVKFVAVLNLILGKPSTASWIIATIDDLGDYVTEDLDVPISNDYLVFIQNLRFMLYTRENKTDPYELISGNKKNLHASPFDPNRPTKLLIHGWQSSYIAGPVQLAKMAFLDSEDVNVIILDYKKYNAPYIAAVGNAKPIAKHFGQFVNFLVNQGGLKLSNTHIIGHSLGAHVAGFLGKELESKVARITGLDPAGPFFYNNRPEDRLDAGDAVYVDSLQTSTLAGISRAITQSDFFPNGGSNQPSCANSPIPAGCDHVYAWEYFAISINSRDQYPARKCANEDQAKVPDAFANVCVPSTAVMGDDAVNRSPVGVYYVDVHVE